MLLAVANQPLDSNPTFTVGADVSRYQRSSVPGRPGAQSTNATAPSGRPGPTNVDGTPTGPVVRVARGNNVTIVPVGAR